VPVIGNDVFIGVGAKSWVQSKWADGPYWRECRSSFTMCHQLEVAGIPARINQRRMSKPSWGRTLSFRHPSMSVTPIKILKFLRSLRLEAPKRQFVSVTKGLDRARFEFVSAVLSREGEFLRDKKRSKFPSPSTASNSLYSTECCAVSGGSPGTFARTVSDWCTHTVFILMSSAFQRAARGLCQHCVSAGHRRFFESGQTEDALQKTACRWQTMSSPIAPPFVIGW